MTAENVRLISPRRRDELFSEIKKLVAEIDAQERSLGAVDEDGALIDEALENIIDMLAAEVRRAKRQSRRRAAVVA
ncbi:MAG: hypothetical protein KIS92_03185 [Planctomycetota bacterium]|nr:hypothetical protein [Planctomycetota bacterium]